MDIIILTTIVLAGIVIESYLSERARRRPKSDDGVVDRLGRGRDPEEK